MKQSFEDYLEDEFGKNHADGVLDDEMGTAFERWLEGLDGNEYMRYAQAWGNKITQ